MLFFSRWIKWMSQSDAGFILQWRLNHLLSVRVANSQSSNIPRLPKRLSLHRGGGVLFISLAPRIRKTCIFSARLATYLHDWNANLQMCSDLARAALTASPIHSLRLKTARGIISPPNKQQRAERPSAFQSKGIYFLIRNYTSSLSIFIDAKPGELCCGERESGRGERNRTMNVITKGFWLKFSLGISKTRLPFDLPNYRTRTSFIVCEDASEREQTSDSGIAFGVPAPPPPQQKPTSCD